MVKNPLANAEAAGGADSIPESGRSPGRGNGNPLQYFGWDNPVDRGIWWATVHGVAKSQTRLKDWTCMQDIIYSSWRGIRSPWLCLMAKLLLLPCLTISCCFYIFSLLWLNLSFGTWGRPRKPKFSTDKRQLEDMGWGSGVVCPGKAPKGPTGLHPQFIRQNYSLKPHQINRIRSAPAQPKLMIFSWMYTSELDSPGK